MQTKIFHQNSDSKTNEYASLTIGKIWQDKIGITTNRDSTKEQEGSRGSSNFGEQVEYNLLPVEFTSLAKGGTVNNFIVEAMVYQGGRVWQSNNKTYLRTSFLQI